MGWRKRKSRKVEPAPEPEAIGPEAIEPEATELPAEEAHSDDEEAIVAGSAEGRSPSTLGASLQLTGELVGNEDMVVHGCVTGTLSLPGHDLQVGPTGRVHADVRARSVVVDGEVVGNITADGRVEVTSTGSILGDIRAGRVVLAEGARYRGNIDMGPDARQADAHDDDVWQETAEDEPQTAQAAMSFFDDADDSVTGA